MLIAAAIAIVQVRTALRTKTCTVIFAKRLIWSIDDERCFYQWQDVNDVIVWKHIEFIFAEIFFIVVFLLVISVDEKVSFDISREIIRHIIEAPRTGASSSTLGFSAYKKRGSRVRDINPPANRIAERVIVRTGGQQGNLDLAIIVRALRKREEL